MSDEGHVELGEVSETLMIPLWCRAVETQRRRALLRDPKAQTIVSELDYDFDGRFAGLRDLAFRACLRTVMIDRWVQDFLRSHPDGAVVEIGTGLNTRFERIDNGTLRWFDVDLPDSLALRRRFFADTPRRTMIEGAFGEGDWLEEIADLLAQGPEDRTNRPILFVSEAVLMYLPEPTVRRGFELIGRSFPGSEFVFDTLARSALGERRMMKTWEAPFVWGCDDPREIEGWAQHRSLARTTMAALPFALRRRVPLKHRLVYAHLRLFQAERLGSHALHRFALESVANPKRGSDGPS